jgi:hypothetical protein
MSAFVVSTVHIDAMLTAGLRLHLPYGDRPLRWWWPEIDAPSDRGSWTSAEAQRQASERERTLTPDSAGRVGAMLLAENRRSMDHRYNEEELEEPYLFRELPRVPDPIVVLKAIDGYRYQSCEHPIWAGSEAAAFCAALQERAIQCLPSYAEAPWGIEHADEVVFPR